MTLTASHVDEGPGVADPVGNRLLDLCAEWGTSLLLEDESGRIVSHAVLGTVPACVVDAIVSRVITPVERTRGSAISVGLMRGGPVLSTSLDGWVGSVTVLPVLRTGRLWVLHRDALPLSALSAGTQSLVEVLERSGARATDESLLDLLQGKRSSGPTPLAGEGRAVLAVTCLDGQVPAVELHAALRRCLPAPLRAQITASAGTAYAVVHIQAATNLDQAIREAGEALGCPLAAVIAPAGEGLVAAREQADRALAARPVTGRCQSLEDCRPYATLPGLLAVLDSAPPMGDDPVADLEPCLAQTLLSWLDHHGDIPAASAALGVHANTFRYRLNRAKEQVNADLLDPITRIDVHLRLHQRTLGTEGPS